MLWTIEPIPLYHFKVPGPEVLFQRAFGETIEMVIYAFLLRSGDGRAVLVDTGLHGDYALLNANIRLRKGPDAGFHPVGAGIEAELARRDARPELIIVSSFGPYAVGGLEHFPATPIVASSRGLADLAQAEEPSMLHPVPPVAAGRLAAARGVAGEENIMPGLRFIEVGIHHPASAAFLAETAEGTIAMADPVFTGRNLVDGLALGAAEFAAGWHAMVRALGGRADAILPSHDPAPVLVPKERWHATLRPS